MAHLYSDVIRFYKSFLSINTNYIEKKDFRNNVLLPKISLDGKFSLIWRPSAFGFWNYLSSLAGATLPTVQYENPVVITSVFYIL